MSNAACAFFVGGGILYDRKENSVFGHDPCGQQALLAMGWL